MKMRNVRLNLFDVQTTAMPGLSAEMKTFYENTLVDMAEPKLVHDRFADKYPIPKNGGKTIELRKYSSLAKATTPLVEGVTPAGKYAVGYCKDCDCKSVRRLYKAVGYAGAYGY